MTAQQRNAVSACLCLFCLGLAVSCSQRAYLPQQAPEGACATTSSAPVTEDQAFVQRLRQSGAIVVRDATRPERPVVQLRSQHRIDLRGIGTLKSLQRLDIRAGVKPGTGYDELADLPSLRELVLDHVYLGNDGFERFPRLPKLEVLEVYSDHRLDDRGIAALLKFTGLRELRLCYTKVGAAGLAQLRALTSLEKLYYMQCRNVGDTELRSAVDVPQLRELAMGPAFFSEVAVRGLQEMPSLTHLYLRCLDDRHMKAVATFSRLESLNLSAAPVTDDGLGELRAMHNLRDLDVSYSKVTAKGLASLGAHPKLRRLTVSGEQLGDPDGSDLARLIHVRELAVTSMDRRLMRTLAGMRHLTSLSLANNTLDDTDVVAIGALANLESLDLKQNYAITHCGLSFLRLLTKLRVLDLSHTGIGDEAVAVLQAVPSLKTIDVSDTHLSATGLLALRRALPRATITFRQTEGRQVVTAPVREHDSDTR